MDPTIVANAVCTYIYNTSGETFARDLFSGSHPDYLAEYAEIWGGSPVSAIGKLDARNFARWVTIVLERYGPSPGKEGSHEG